MNEHQLTPGATDLLTIEEVAAELRLKRKTVNGFVRDGRLGHVQLTRTERRVTRGQLEAFIKVRTVAPPNPVDKNSSKRIPSPRKGGKSATDSDKAQLREEMREWL